MSGDRVPGSAEAGVGIVLETIGGNYRVRFDDGSVVDASIRGRLKQDARAGERIVAGDRVRAASGGGTDGVTVEEVLPRSNELVRAGPGGRRPKVAAANLDRCLVVLSATEPPFRPDVADRFLALSESCRIPPVLVLNKMDQAGAESVADVVTGLYAPIGYEVLPTSVPDRTGLEELSRTIAHGLSVIIGPSGVGKSSLLNAMAPDLQLRTAPVSRGGRGRHTTVSARLLEISPDGWVVDTPGFSDLSLWGVDPKDLQRAFPEILAESEHCRFRGCSHTHEPECQVKEAVSEGTIASTRYETYCAMSDEAA